MAAQKSLLRWATELSDERKDHCMDAIAEAFKKLENDKAPFSGCSPHHRRWHFAKFYEQDGVIKIMPIRGSRNPANALTKFTFGALYIKERKYILGIMHD